MLFFVAKLVSALYEQPYRFFYGEEAEEEDDDDLSILVVGSSNESLHITNCGFNFKSKIYNGVYLMFEVSLVKFSMILQRYFCFLQINGLQFEAGKARKYKRQTAVCTTTSSICKFLSNSSNAHVPTEIQTVSTQIHREKFKKNSLGYFLRLVS